MNHARQEQDLLSHYMTEWEAELALIAEPYNVPENPSWAADVTRRAAICVAGAGAAMGLTRIESGHGFVVARWRDMSYYISPNLAMADFEKTLRDIQPAIR